MNAEQKALTLDAATELQTNDEFWREFEFKADKQTSWSSCSATLNPLQCHWHVGFRRKPRTITVTLPVPKAFIPLGPTYSVNVAFKTEEDRDQALAAIREATKDE